MREREENNSLEELAAQLTTHYAKELKGGVESQQLSIDEVKASDMGGFEVVAHAGTSEKSLRSVMEEIADTTKETVRANFKDSVITIEPADVSSGA
ncbi:hypothetical protein ACFL04_04130 [Patescibacteria group bacterium]